MKVPTAISRLVVCASLGIPDGLAAQESALDPTSSPAADQTQAAETTPQTPAPPNTTLLIDSNGNFWLREGGLEKKYVSVRREDMGTTKLLNKRVVTIEAHRDTPAQYVMQAIDTLKKAGVTNLQLQQAEVSTEEARTTVIRLRHAPASSVADALNHLYTGDNNVKIVPEQVSNSIIVHAPTGILTKVMELVTTLEDATAQNAAQQGTVSDLMPPGESPAKPNQPSTDPFGHQPPSTTDASQGLRNAYQSADRKAMQTAAQLRGSDPNSPRGRDLGRLRTDVAGAFEARQNLQRAEAAALRERLSRIEQAIAARERVKDKIIENRVAELLDPNLQWDHTSSLRPSAAEVATPQPTVDQLRAPVSPSDQPAVANPFGANSSSPVATAGTSLIMRSADQFRERLRNAQGNVDFWVKQVSKGEPGKKNWLEQAQEQLRAVRAEYAAQLRLLELEMQEAEMTWKTTNELLRQGALRGEPGQLLLEAERARIRLEQLKTLYELYQGAGKNENSEKDKPEEDRSAKPKSSPAPSDQGIQWRRDLEVAKREALNINRLVLIHFTASWNKWSAQVEQQVFTQKEVIGAIDARYVPVRLDYDAHQQIAKEFGVRILPSDVVMTADGTRIDDFNTPQTAELFLQRIGKAAESAKRASDSNEPPP